MTTYTGTITNGSATIEIDTTGMNSGAYDVSTTYTQNNKYTSATKQSLLTLGSTPTPTITRIGTGTGTDWTSNMWSAIEINSAKQAHSNYTCNPSILKKVPLTGDFTLKAHIGMAMDNNWGWGLCKTNTSITDTVLSMRDGNTMNGSSVATMFGNTSTWDWDTTYEFVMSRSGTTYTVEYRGNTYTFTDSYTGTLYYFMWKTGNGNIFLTSIETTASLNGGG